MQRAAIQVSICGRERPRRVAWAEIAPQRRQPRRCRGAPDAWRASHRVRRADWAPLTQRGPASQFAQGDEGDADPGTEESSQQRRRELLLDAQRGDVGVKDDTAHVSGDVRAAHGVEVGEELLALIVVEHTVAGEVLSLPDRLAPFEQVVHRWDCRMWLGRARAVDRRGRAARRAPGRATRHRRSPTARDASLHASPAECLSARSDVVSTTNIKPC